MTVSELFLASEVCPPLRRSYHIGMPQMLLGGLSERWLLKESGDVHWALVCRDLGVASRELMDAEGDRLYASFLRVRMEASANLRNVRESDRLTLEGTLTRFGDKRYFSSLVYRTDGGVEIRCTLNSVFISRANDNRSLARAKARAFERSTCYPHLVVPPFGQEYHAVKNVALGTDTAEGPILHLGGEPFEWTAEERFTTEYTVNPYHDFNGVSLLYFASYGRIHDVCEREFIRRRARQDDWALVSAPVARDIFYYANADAGEKLVFKLFRCDLRADFRLRLHSALFRASDGVRMADIFTIRQVADRRSDLAALWDVS